MRISDWSSDVCSSDLHRPSRRAPRKAGMMTLETPTSGGRRPILRLRGWQDEPNGENERTSESISAGPPRLRLTKSRSNNRNRIDRTSAVSGTSVSDRVDLGGRRLIKQTKQERNQRTKYSHNTK